MSDTYLIHPQSGRFSNEALAEWRTFLDGLPTRVMENGQYQVFETVRERDGFAEYAARSGRQHTVSAEYVSLEPRVVTLHIVARAFAGDVLAAFLEDFGRRWPIRIVGVFGHELTVDALCKEIGALPRE
ncbi:MAG: hypothetical protein JWN44_4616 [Myxococcales bacterium]|nr:hypothetical protein [Myxococcales bacterium]